MRRPAINCRDRRSPSRPGPDGCHCGHPSRPSQISMNAIERGECMIARHGFRILLALLFSTAAAVEAAPRPTVVELYTSEGCSSCPPAKEYLGELTNRNDVLPLSFHVDYWDELGWRDPLAFSASTGRQRGYAARLGLHSIFTPQVVIDGRESLVGSDRRRIARRLDAASSPSIDLELARQGGDLVVSVGSESSSGSVDVVLVPFRRRVISAIGRGENQGRTLTEFNVARELRVIGHTRGAESLHIRVALDSLPKDATDVAVLAQRPSQGEIVGATQLDLSAHPAS
jgi:hypothetical protein